VTDFLLLPRYGQVLHPTAALHAHRLRVKPHELENVLRHVRADRKAERIDAEFWHRQIKQDRIFQFADGGLDGIAEPDIDHDADARPADVGVGRKAQAAIFGFVADRAEPSPPN
jgi:hypothetical protein